jgi:hypothetical protein
MKRFVGRALAQGYYSKNKQILLQIWNPGVKKEKITNIKICFDI